MKHFSMSEKCRAEGAGKERTFFWGVWGCLVLKCCSLLLFLSLQIWNRTHSRLEAGSGSDRHSRSRRPCLRSRERKAVPWHTCAAFPPVSSSPHTWGWGGWAGRPSARLLRPGACTRTSPCWCRAGPPRVRRTRPLSWQHNLAGVLGFDTNGGWGRGGVWE